MNRLWPAAVFVLVVAIGQTACSDRYTWSLDSPAEARERGLVERGWVPDWIPESSRDIMLSYDLDTNEVWLTLSLASDDRHQLQGRLVPTRVDGTHVRRPTIGWPTFLTGVLNQQDIERQDYESFAAIDRGWFAAVNWAEDRVCLWKPAS